MVSVDDFEFAPDVVWIGRYPGDLCRNMSRDAAMQAVEARPW